jgi:hypothetical protein
VAFNATHTVSAIQKRHQWKSTKPKSFTNKGQALSNLCSHIRNHEDSIKPLRQQQQEQWKCFKSDHEPAGHPKQILSAETNH